VNQTVVYTRLEPVIRVSKETPRNMSPFYLETMEKSNSTCSTIDPL
jgi:hypothetical protein